MASCRVLIRNLTDAWSAEAPKADRHRSVLMASFGCASETDLGPRLAKWFSRKLFFSVAGLLQLPCRQDNRRGPEPSVRKTLQCQPRCWIEVTLVVPAAHKTLPTPRFFHFVPGPLLQYGFQRGDSWFGVLWSCLLRNNWEYRSGVGPLSGLHLSRNGSNDEAPAPSLCRECLCGA